MATLFVENLTVLDFSRLDAERGLVGESWIVDIELSGELDAHNMVFDFGHVKRAIKQALDQAMDHCLVVPMQDARLQWQSSEGRVQLQWRYGKGHILLDAPAESVFPIETGQVTQAAAIEALVARLQQVVPANVSSIVLRLRDEAIGDEAHYHYSHGLRHHDGNCQRIAHGHRSRLMIEENGQRNRQREHHWAKCWQDIYLGSREDLRATDEIDGVAHYRFSYRAKQGYFELTLPVSACYLLDTDTTVELIAAHVAATLAANAPASRFRVHAFEGVGKGAIA